MLSQAAIRAWPCVENIASRRHLFGTERDVVMAVAFCIIKKWAELSSFSEKKKGKKQKQLKQIKNILYS